MDSGCSPWPTAVESSSRIRPAVTPLALNHFICPWEVILANTNDIFIERGCFFVFVLFFVLLGTSGRPQTLYNTWQSSRLCLTESRGEAIVPATGGACEGLIKARQASLGNGLVAWEPVWFCTMLWSMGLGPGNMTGSSRRLTMAGTSNVRLGLDGPCTQTEVHEQPECCTHLSFSMDVG